MKRNLITILIGTNKMNERIKNYHLTKQNQEKLIQFFKQHTAAETSFGKSGEK